MKVFVVYWSDVNKSEFEGSTHVDTTRECEVVEVAHIPGVGCQVSIQVEALVGNTLCNRTAFSSCQVTVVGW